MTYTSQRTIASSKLPAVLCIDDELPVLDGVERVLRGHFAVTKATNGADAIVALQYGGPFHAVVCDFRLAETDGVRILSQIRELSPDTVRVLLTGRAAIDDAVAAVNEGHIFGFARKPCRPDVLVALVTSAVNEHQLIVRERELLEETLQGSIRALTELLAVSSPAASGRATRVTRYACDLAATLNCQSWEISVAAMVSQIGCLTLPPDLAERVCRGGCLTEEEQRLVHTLPWVAENILAKIPRLEGVRAILNHQNTRFDQVGPVGESVGTGAPMGARILAVAVAFDTLDCQGVVVEDILKRLHARHGLYDPKVLEALSLTTSFMGGALETRDVLLSEVEIGMVLLGDVLSPTGVMLIAKGQNITANLHERIRTYWSGFADRQHVRVASAASR